MARPCVIIGGRPTPRLGDGIKEKFLLNNSNNEDNDSKDNEHKDNNNNIEQWRTHASSLGDDPHPDQATASKRSFFLRTTTTTKTTKMTTAKTGKRKTV